MTPTKEQIELRARELYVTDQYRNGTPQHGDTNPEYSELVESGYVMLARNELMRSEDSSYKTWLEKEYVEAKGKTKSSKSTETNAFAVDIKELLRSGVFISGTSGIGKTTLGFRIAQELIKHNVILFVIDPSQAWRKFQQFKNVVRIYPTKTPQKINWNDEHTLFDTSALSPRDQLKFTELFCKNVMNAAINRHPQDRPSIVVVIEEAHTAIYNGSMRSIKAQETARLLTQGRNFKIRFIAITQFPAMVDKLLVKLAQQRYNGRTSEKNDLDYLHSFLGDRVRELEGLKVGQFVYFNCGKLSKIRVEAL